MGAVTEFQGVRYEGASRDLMLELADLSRSEPGRKADLTAELMTIHAFHSELGARVVDSPPGPKVGGLVTMNEAGEMTLWEREPEASPAFVVPEGATTMTAEKPRTTEDRLKVRRDYQ